MLITFNKRSLLSWSFIVLAVLVLCVWLLLDNRTNKPIKDAEAKHVSSAETPSPRSSGDTNNDLTMQQSTQSTSKSSTQTSSSALETTSIQEEAVTKDCNHFTTIPYKYVFIPGKGPIVFGQEGMSQTCYYSDNRPPEASVFMKPIDEIVYMNVYTADYDSAVNICSSYPVNYQNDCISVVMQPR